MADRWRSLNWKYFRCRGAFVCTWSTVTFDAFVFNIPNSWCFKEINTLNHFMVGADVYLNFIFLVWYHSSLCFDRIFQTIFDHVLGNTIYVRTIEMDTFLMIRSLSVDIHRSDSLFIDIWINLQLFRSRAVKVTVYSMYSLLNKPVLVTKASLPVIILLWGMYANR